MKERLEDMEQRLVLADLQAEALKLQLLELQKLQHMDVPDFAKEAVNAAVAGGLIDTPDGGSYDFYRTLTVLHRKGLV